MTKPTLLFVHGAWHGSWCWTPLTDLLAARGWRITTIDLPTVHAANKHTLGMYDDADAVAAAITDIDGPVVVVAHSYGGVPVTQAALDPRVEHIVYITAFVLDENETLLASTGGTPPSWWNLDGALLSAGNAEHRPQDLFYADVSSEEADAATAQLLPMAVQAVRDPLTAVAWRDRPTTYIVGEDDAIFPAEGQRALATRSGSSIVSLKTSHSPFMSQPERVADIIEAAANA